MISKGWAFQLVSCIWWGWSGACHSGGNRIQRGQESGLCLPFLEWMAQQLLYSPWGRVGDRDSQITLPGPLAGVWILIMVNSEECGWGWCGLGTWIECGMTLAKECDHYLFVVIFAHFGLVWKHIILFLSALSCNLAFSLNVWRVYIIIWSLRASVEIRHRSST